MRRSLTTMHYEASMHQAGRERERERERKGGGGGGAVLRASPSCIRTHMGPC